MGAGIAACLFGINIPKVSSTPSLTPTPTPTPFTQYRPSPLLANEQYLIDGYLNAYPTVKTKGNKKRAAITSTVKILYK